VTKTSNEIAKSSFGRKIHVNNKFMLKESSFTMEFKYDFLSYLILEKMDIYIVQHCSYLKFTMFCNRFTLGLAHMPPWYT
jgi:hypothetical protein